MYEKDGRFYADWRDRKGKRLRKSFTSQRAALRFEAEQKELAHPKTKALGRRLRTFSTPPTPTTPFTDAQRATSSQRQAVSPPKDSQRLRLLKPTKR